MGADQLRAWEVILSSPVAVALLLLAAVVVLGGVLGLWIRRLVAENRQLHTWIREHLEAEAGVSRALDDLYPILDLIHHGQANEASRAVGAGLAHRVEGTAAPAGLADGLPAPGDGGAATLPGGGP